MDRVRLQHRPESGFWKLRRCWVRCLGATTRIAPGYKLSISYWKLELYSEDEYVIDAHSSSGKFLYN